MENEYYVYGCFVDDELKYVGKGKGNRYTHCTSGASSCVELNRDFFAGRNMKVKKLKENLSDDDAKDIEKLLIDLLGDRLYNVTGNKFTQLSSLTRNTYAIPKNVVKASGYIGKEGELVIMSLVDKMVYGYYLDILFYNRKSGVITTTFEDVAKEIGLEKKSVNRSVNKFIQHNIISGYKDITRGFTSWHYNSIDINPTLWNGTEEDYVLMSGEDTE